jgi:hypothetical protein
MARAVHFIEVTNIYKHQNLEKVRFSTVGAQSGHGEGAKRACQHLDVIADPLAGALIGDLGCVPMFDSAPKGASSNILKQWG